MNQDLRGKKLLIIGGSFQHCQLVEKAHKLGVITYVVDWLPLEEAPAKQISDYYYNYNIFDIDAIVELCRQEKIDGVLSTHLDACQLPYYQVCEKLGVPCYGTAEQFRIFTDKIAFKAFLQDNGLDTIPAYDEKLFCDQDTCQLYVDFPVFVKPCISCNSKGQAICRTYEEAVEAIKIAKQVSRNGEVLVEKYIEKCDDLAVTLLVLDGKVYIERVGDRYLGKEEDNLNRFSIYCPWPSKNRDFVQKNVFPKLERALLGLGIKNAPVFIQGFVDGDTLRFYDAGLRFPGNEFERVFERVFGRNSSEIFITFALSGKISFDEKINPEEFLEFADHKGALLYFMIRPGTIGEISGVEKVRSHRNVVCFFQRYREGSIVEPTYNSKQSVAEIYILTTTDEEMKETLDFIYNTLRVTDQQGENMVLSRVDHYGADLENGKWT